MAWLYLFVAATFEVGFTSALKWISHGGGWKAQVAFLTCAVLSFGFLERAIATIPLGVAYAVWTGLGSVGTVFVTRFVFGETLNAWQFAFIVLLIASIIGLKLSSSH